MFIIREELNYGIRTHNVLSTVASLNHWAGTFKPRMTSFRLVVRQHERRVQVVSSNPGTVYWMDIFSHTYLL